MESELLQSKAQITELQEEADLEREQTTKLVAELQEQREAVSAKLGNLREEHRALSTELIELKKTTEANESLWNAEREKLETTSELRQYQAVEAERSGRSEKTV